ncbi:MAG TPA: hypothetical protein VMK32_00440 [Burkholderiaceae bacterium]|nr:hypothetical protein [Burkholderiaceae bacterium]
MRLGLVQTALGAIVILATSTMNRVMVVELALPATLRGMLVRTRCRRRRLCSGCPRLDDDARPAGVRPSPRSAHGALGCVAGGRLRARRALGTRAIDIARWLLNGTEVAYAVVFGGEGVLFVVSAAIAARLALPAARTRTVRRLLPGLVTYLARR